jgi:hypothetical protein
MKKQQPMHLGKTSSPCSYLSTLRRTSAAILLAVFGVSSALAEVVYVTARPTPCTVTAECPGPNTDGTYSEEFPGLGDFGAAGTASGHPQTTVARTYIGSPEITDTNYGVILTPTLGTPGGVYQIDYNFNSVAGNTSTNVIMSVACTAGGTLSFSETDKFQRQYGNPANQWQFMGYLTNNPGSVTPTIEFRYKSGRVSGAGAGAAGNRLLFDCWRFTLVEPCLQVPVVNVIGPLGASLNEVVVSGVDADATAVTVYQNSGAGMVQIGVKSSGVTAGNNTVTVSGLIQGAQVVATQTINGQQGCVPPQGPIVGGGANPPIRIALTIRETTNLTATIGAPGNLASPNLHFLGATTVSPASSGGAPVDAAIFYPSNGWQTVTISRGSKFVGNPTSVSGIATVDGGYSPNDSVSVQIYAIRVVPETGVTVYSRVPAESTAVTSNDVFGVEWTWAAVPDAEGYKLLRNVNGAGYNEGTEMWSTGPSFTDMGNMWFYGTTVTPTSSQTGASVQWNPTVGNVNTLPGRWGALESINFAIADTDNTGPFDIYIDNIQNGSTVFQTLEAAPANTLAYGFWQPGFSGTTAGHLLAGSSTVVANNAAYQGTKSLRIRFQWSGLTPTRWLRLTTSAGAIPVVNPFVDLDEPITFQMLMQPVGAPLPPPPPPPTISATLVNGQVVLNWEGGHRLQTAVDVSGTYTEVPQSLGPPNTFLGPWTNSFTEPTRFFRLLD